MGAPKGSNDARTIEWLLEGDPSIRWQTLRDLVGANERDVERERSRVAREGWGAQLLALQDVHGIWGNGLYTPKWTSTFYTLLLLRDLGLASGNAAAKRACAVLFEKGLRTDGGLGYGPSPRSETCITGMALSMGCHFEHKKAPIEAVVRHLLEQQMADGGWNCRRPRGATHSSMHTTISVLEGLRLYELCGGRLARDVRTAQQRAREFLLAHRLFRSHRTGSIIKTEFMRMVFPPRWHYDVLRALDYFRSVNAERDRRLEEGAELVCRKRRWWDDASKRRTRRARAG